MVYDCDRCCTPTCCSPRCKTRGAVAGKGRVIERHASLRHGLPVADSLDAVMDARLHSVMIDWHRGASDAARNSTRQHMGA